MLSNTWHKNKLLHMHVFLCARLCEFWGRNSVKGEECKTREKCSIFLKKGKMVILGENRKFSRSRTMKRTSSFISSREI